MRHPFSLFQTPIDWAHHYWNLLLKKGDKVIDATCGNGQDLLFLARKVGKEGIVYGCDIQEKAIERAKQLLKEQLTEEELLKVTFIKGCHSIFPNEILPGTIKLIVYNLGYLPHGDKSMITKVETTLKSVQAAKDLLASGGALSLTCYPGHAGGDLEEEAVLALVKSWDPTQWSCCHHRWVNRNKSPSLLLIQKSNDPFVANQ